MMRHMIGELTDGNPPRWCGAKSQGCSIAELGWWNLVERKCHEIQKPDHSLLQCVCSDRIDHMRMVADF